MERDYQKDLEVCEKATQGPWIDLAQCGHIESDNRDVADVWHTVDGDFVITARTALPWYIKHCMELQSKLQQAEEREKKLKDALGMVGMTVAAYEYPAKDRLEWIEKQVDQALNEAGEESPAHD